MVTSKIHLLEEYYNHSDQGHTDRDLMLMCTSLLPPRNENKASKEQVALHYINHTQRKMWLLAFTIIIISYFTKQTPPTVWDFFFFLLFLSRIVLLFITSFQINCDGLLHHMQRQPGNPVGSNSYSKNKILLLYSKERK